MRGLYLPLHLLLFLVPYDGNGLDLLQQLLGTQETLDDLLVLGHGYVLVGRQVFARPAQILVAF